MPYSYPFSFRRRKTPHRGTASQTTTTTTTTQSPRRRNKLRKRPHFWYSSTNTSTLHLASDSSDLVMGSKSSRLGDMSRPTRPPRPSVDELPDLPSLPMYHVLTEKHHPAVIPAVDKKKPKTDLKSLELNLADPKPPPIPLKSPSRRTSICEWPLNNTPVDPCFHPRPAAKQEQHYDRASHLAESYRALLSPMTVGSGSRCATPVVDTGMQKQHRDPVQERSGDSSEKQRPARIHTLLHLGNRQLHPELVSPEPRVLSLTAPLHVARAPERNPQARPPSTASSSSLTVVDVPAESPSPSAASLTDDASIYSYASPPHQDHHGQRWSVASFNYGESDCSPTPRIYSLPDQSHSPSPTKPPFSGDHQHHNNKNHDYSAQSDRRTSNDLGLQICADMLADHLKRVLFLHTTDTNEAGPEMEKENQRDREKSKLQILLLIEAYEAALASAKKEVEAVARHPPIVRGQTGDGNGVKRRTATHVREAVRILEHWLGVLYGIYDDDFGEGGML